MSRPQAQAMLDRVARAATAVVLIAAFYTVLHAVAVVDRLARAVARCEAAARNRCGRRRA